MDEINVCMTAVDAGKICQLTAHLQRCKTCRISRLTPRNTRLCAAAAFLMQDTLTILRATVVPAYDLATDGGAR